MDPPPDRATHCRIIDEKWQGLVADRVADADPPPVRLAAVALRQPEAGERIAAQGHFLTAVHAAHGRIVEGGGQVAQPVAVPGQHMLVEKDHDVAASLFHRPVPAPRPGRLSELDEAGERELADDVPGAVGRARVGADDLERRPPLAHDAV